MTVNHDENRVQKFDIEQCCIQVASYLIFANDSKSNYRETAEKDLLSMVCSYEQNEYLVNDISRRRSQGMHSATQRNRQKVHKIYIM